MSIQLYRIINQFPNSISLVGPLCKAVFLLNSQIPFWVLCFPAMKAVHKFTHYYIVH